MGRGMLSSNDDMWQQKSELLKDATKFDDKHKGYSCLLVVHKVFLCLSSSFLTLMFHVIIAGRLHQQL